MNFSIQNSDHNINYMKNKIKKKKEYCRKFNKTLIIVCLCLFFQLSVSSCKTCKCPAYSQIAVQNPPNMRNPTT